MDKLEERLLRHIEKITESGCWLWAGCNSNHGYGQITIRPNRYLAHRLSYEIYKGPIPKNMHVLHKCDIKECCNPDHLFLGANQENIEDSSKKLRRGRVLDAETVKKIKNDSGTCAKLAEKYSVCATTINMIQRGKTWRYA